MVPAIFLLQGEPKAAGRNGAAPEARLQTAQASVVDPADRAASPVSWTRNVIDGSGSRGPISPD
jgi:hypothetical protein